MSMHYGTIITWGMVWLKQIVRCCIYLTTYDRIQIIPKNNDRTKKAEPYMEILRIRLIRFTD
jgi:hypothetical protein